VLNAPPVLVELADHASSWRAGDPPHVINLTLLPQTEEDLAYLLDRLGTGAAALLSRGYGNCRITATRMRHVWWVQYFNSEDALILNTLEVIDVPAVALAAMEDIEDSAQRLAEILETLA
jgi:hydrogenase-1 operon protein HyaF